MPKATKSALERLAAIQAEIASLEDKAAKQKAAIRARETRTRQRQAFLLGECLLAQATLPESFKRDLGAMLDAYLTKRTDRDTMADWLPQNGQSRPPALDPGPGADVIAEHPDETMQVDTMPARNAQSA